VIPHDAAAIFTVSANTAHLLRMSGWEHMGISDIPENFPLTNDELRALAGMAASGQPLVIQDTSEDERWRVESHRLSWVRSFAAAPLFDDQRTFGVMALFCSQPNFFSPSHLELLQGFASQAATAARNARLYEEVTRSHDELRSLSDQMMRAIEDERRRISGELHDEVGQVLTALILNADFVLGALGDKCDDKVHQRLIEISKMARTSLEQLRDLSLRLRPAMLDELGLEPTLRWYTSAFADRTGLEVHLTVTGFDDNRFGFSLETTLYRAVQEALTNVARHAEATTVTVELEKHPHLFDLTIRDDGKGFNSDAFHSPETPKGLGLLGMRERVQSLGGELRIRTFPNDGTTIEIKLPDLGDSDTAPGVS
jgi:signal transduction histidine kinase